MLKISDMTDAELTAWITNFVAVVGASPADYGLTAGQVTDFQNDNTNFKNKMTACVAAKEASKSASEAKKTSRQTAESKASYFDTILEASPDISDAAKVAAGIELRKPPTHTPPIAPTNLVVNGYEDGTNVLKWDKAGNKPTTQFIVEYREAADTEFEYLAATTETTYGHTGATPGMQCAYRVKAQRAGNESAYSNTAVVYMS